MGTIRPAVGPGLRTVVVLHRLLIRNVEFTGHETGETFHVQLDGRARVEAFGFQTESDAGTGEIDVSSRFGPIGDLGRVIRVPRGERLLPAAPANADDVIQTRRAGLHQIAAIVDVDQVVLDVMPARRLRVPPRVAKSVAG